MTRNTQCLKSRRARDELHCCGSASSHATQFLHLLALAATILGFATALSESVSAQGITPADLDNWDPEFAPYVNQVEFDNRNRPYIRQRGTTPNVDGTYGYVSTLRYGQWIALEYFDDIKAARQATEVTGLGAGGLRSSQVVFDQDGDAYTAIRAELHYDPNDPSSETKNLLLHSRDACETWTVYELPSLGSSFTMETTYSPEPIEGPPAILLYACGSVRVPSCLCSQSYKGRHGRLTLLVPRKSGTGELLADPNGVLLADGYSVVVSRDCLGITEHSGAGAGSPNMVLTDQDKVYVVWPEALDIGIPCDPNNPCDGPDDPNDPNYQPCDGPRDCYPDDPGAPTYIACYDRDTLVLGDIQHLLDAVPTNDPHDMPGVVMDTSGYLHVVSGAHSKVFKYVKSSSPRDVTNWETVTTVPGPCCRTYLGLVRDSADTLHLVYRDRYESTCPPDDYLNDWSLDHQMRNSNGTWAPAQAQALLAPGLLVPPKSYYYNYYHRLSIDRHDRLYVSFSVYSLADQCPLQDPNDPNSCVEETCTMYPVCEAMDRHHMRGLITSPDGGVTWKLAYTEDFGYWVDFSAASGGDGSYDDPHDTLTAGLGGVVDGETLSIMPGSSDWTGSIDQYVVLIAPQGTVTIGSTP